MGWKQGTFHANILQDVGHVHHLQSKASRPEEIAPGWAIMDDVGGEWLVRMGECRKVLFFCLTALSVDLNEMMCIYI